MKRILEKPHFRSWLALVGVITILAGTAFVLAQQSAYFSATNQQVVDTEEAITKDSGAADDQIATYGVLVAAGWLASVSWVTLVYFFAGHLTEQRVKS